MIPLAVALAGGLGALCRFLLDHAVARLAVSGRLPLGTLVVNVTGSFLVGLVAGWWAVRSGDPGLRQVLGTGFLGGYTTFSTACVETVRLVRGERAAAATLHALGMLAGSVAAAAAGFWLGGA